MTASARLLGIVAALAAVLSEPSAQGTVVVQGQVFDAESKEPIAARIYVQSVKAGTWHFVTPAGDAGKVVVYDRERSPRSTERHTSVSAHPFLTELEPGEYDITIEQGKEYIPNHERITVGDKPFSLKFMLRRWSRVAERGWYSGDTHVHRTMEDLPVAMLAEDLNVALPLNYWVTKSHTPPSAGDKSISGEVGTEVIKVDATHVIYPMNTEYEIFTVKDQRHTLGAVFVLNHKKRLDMGVPPVTPVMQDARKQGALLDLDKHSWPWSMMLIPVMNVDLFELSNNHIWRTEFFFKQWTKEVYPEGWDIETDADGWTEWGWMDFGFKCYYALLNCGFDMKPTGGTASGVHPVPLGFGRVYVQVEGPFTYEKWINGLKAGRSFVTTGPMLEVTFNGKSPGSRWEVKGMESEALTIDGVCSYHQPISRLEVIVNGETVRTLKPQAEKVENGAYRHRFTVEHPVEESSWIAVRAFSEENGRLRFAHSAPVHIAIPNRPLQPKRQEVRYFVRRMQEEIARNQSLPDAESLSEYQKALEAFQKLEKNAR